MLQLTHKQWALVVLLVVKAAVGMVYSFATPLFEASDEVWHYPVVREIAEGRGLPVQEIGVERPWAQQGSQPPLYYLMMGAATAWVDVSDYETVTVLNPFVRAGIPGTRDNVNMVLHRAGEGPWQGGTWLAGYIIRWLSVGLGVLTTWFAWGLASTLWPEREDVALLTAALVGLTPMVLFINGSVNNDNLLMVLGALVLWLLVREVLSDVAGYRWRATVGLGVALGALALTKISGLVLLPVSALAVTISSWRMNDWRAWLVRGGVLVAMVALVAGWWYARNMVLYGEILGINTMAGVAGARPAGFTVLDLLPEWGSFWYSLWGVFGVFNVLAPGWFYAAVNGFSLWAAVGLVVGLGMAVRQGMSGEARWGGHVVLLVAAGVTFASLIYWSTLTQATQGRLMFGVLPAVMVYLAWGGLWLVPHGRRWGVAVGLSTGYAVLALGVAVVGIAPHYQPVAAVSALPAGAQPLDVVYGDGMRLVGYSVPARQVVAPGEALAVTLYWTADGPIAENINVGLAVLDANLGVVARRDTWPGGGLRPTSGWQVGEVYPDTYYLETTAGDVLPSRLQLTVSAWQGEVENRLGVMVNGAPAESVLLAVGGLAEPVGDDRLDVAQVASRFEGGIVLSDYELLQQPGQLTVLTVWTTEAEVGIEYTLFLHVYNEAGVLVAQADGPPVGGVWPTSLWRVGEQIVESRAVDLSGVATGTYVVRAGWYDPATGVRLGAVRFDGEAWGDAAVELGRIAVSR